MCDVSGRDMIISGGGMGLGVILSGGPRGPYAALYACR